MKNDRFVWTGLQIALLMAVLQLTEPRVFAYSCQYCGSQDIVIHYDTNPNTAEAYDPAKPSCLCTFDSTQCSYDMESDPQRTSVTYLERSGSDWVITGRGVAYFYYCNTDDGTFCEPC